MMIKSKERLEFSGLSVEKVQFFCLLFLGLADFLIVTVSPLFPWLAEFMVNQYLVIPAVLFVGASLTVRQSPAAVRALLLGAVTVVWLAVAQCAQRQAWGNPQSTTMWWPAYLLAFPFAAVVKDGDRKKGLWLLGAAAIAISMVMTVCSMMLSVYILPDFLAEAVEWDNEGRLVAMNHPNLSGWLFMLGIAFSIGLSFEVKNKWIRVGLLGAAVLQLMMQALTNSRTSNLMTCALIAGVVFFCIYRGGWKRFLIGILAAGVVVGSLFVMSSNFYKWNYARLTAPAVSQSEEEVPATEPERSSPSAVEEENPPEITRTRNSFWADLKTFTGRTGIWKAGIQALKDNPVYMLRGVDYVGSAIEAAGNPFGVLHSHNAWLEILVGFGIPALLLSLVFTFLAVRGVLVMLFSRRSSMLQKCVAMLVGCMLVAGILEPFLFTPYFYCHFISVMFLLCTGYLDRWQAALRGKA